MTGVQGRFIDSLVRGTWETFPATGVIRHATGDRDLQEPVNLEVATIHIDI